MRLQPPCASSWLLTWLDIVSRDLQLRSVRVLHFWLASMVPLIGSVVKELTYSYIMERSTCRCGPLGGDLWLVATTFNERFNVELWLLPAYGSRVSMRAACPVDLKLNGGRARIC